LPQFSVIVPTTRPHLLRYSVRSVLAQTVGDFEVIVSDNQASGVEAAVRDVGDARVRYARTPARLPIHKSWEFALEQARGDWVLLLADDDVILPGLLAALQALARADASAEIVTWRHGGFVDPRHPSAAIRGRVDLPAHSGEVLRFDNRDNLRLLFALGGAPEQFAAMKRRQPHPAQGAYRMDLVRRIKARSGDLFLPTTPDWAAITQVLAAGRETFVLDAPYTLYNSTVDSNAAAATGDTARIRAVYAEFTHEPFSNVPFKGILTNRNIIADTVLDVQKRWPELAGYRIEPAAYFRNVCYGLAQVERQSGTTAEVRDEMAELARALEGQPPALRDEIRDYLKAQRTPAATAAARAPALRPLRRLAADLLDALLLRGHRLLGAYPLRRVMRRGLSTRAAFAGTRDILEFSQLAGRLLGQLA